jgi:hypothetical protein
MCFLEKMCVYNQTYMVTYAERHAPEIRRLKRTYPNFEFAVQRTDIIYRKSPRSRWSHWLKRSSKRRSRKSRSRKSRSRKSRSRKSRSRKSRSRKSRTRKSRSRKSRSRKSRSRKSRSRKSRSRKSRTRRSRTRNSRSRRRNRKSPSRKRKPRSRRRSHRSRGKSMTKPVSGTGVRRVSARAAFDRGMALGTPMSIPQPGGGRVVKCLSLRSNGSPYWGFCR